jgi:ribosomal protein S18 acetylase RimI-like enzyme
VSLERIERYADAAPREAAQVEEHGPLRLFVGKGPWPYYARPSGLGEPTPEDVAAVRARQAELRAPEAFEWIGELAPGLAPAARRAGLKVREQPLMVLRGAVRAQAPPLRVRLLAPDDPALPAADAVARVGFAAAGTARGAAGEAERDAAAAAVPEAALAFRRDRLAAGTTVMAVAEDDGGPVAVGAHQPVGDVSELVGVATLPAARRQGLGAAVTAALAADARERGAEIVFLSAGGEDVARVYDRLGFARVATAGSAEV